MNDADGYRVLRAMGIQVVNPANAKAAGASALPAGWEYSECSNTLQSPGGSILQASSDPARWSRQIAVFEADSAVRPPEQIAALRCEASEGPVKITRIPPMDYMPPSIEPTFGQRIRLPEPTTYVRKIEWSAPNDPASFNSAVAVEEEKVEALPCREPSRERVTAMAAISKDVFQIIFPTARFNPLVSDGELAALRERDNALAERDSARAEADQMRRERDGLVRVMAAANQMIEAKDARIAALDTMLAQRPAPAEPKPSAHNPYREFAGDRRRVRG